MVDMFPSFMKFVARPWFRLLLGFLALCFIVVAIVDAGVCGAWAGFSPGLWMLLAIAAILGILCSELAGLYGLPQAPATAAAVVAQVPPAVPVVAAAPAAPPAASTPAAPAAAAPEVEQVEIYCVKCRERRTISNPEKVTLSSGHPALQGHCPVCGTKVNRIVKAAAGK